MSDITLENFGSRLISVVPEFGGIYKEHLRQNGEPVNHLLAHELALWLMDTAAHQSRPKASIRDKGSIHRALDFVEQAAHSKDSRVIDLIVLSFLSDFAASLAPHNELINSMGPKSKELLQKYLR